MSPWVQYLALYKLGTMAHAYNTSQPSDGGGGKIRSSRSHSTIDPVWEQSGLYETLPLSWRWRGGGLQLDAPSDVDARASTTHFCQYKAREG